MMRRPRRKHTAAFKAKVAVAASKGDKTLAGLAEEFDVHANRITQWKAQLVEAATGVFLTPAAKREPVRPSVKDMQGKTGQLALFSTSQCVRESWSTSPLFKTTQTNPIRSSEGIGK